MKIYLLKYVAAVVGLTAVALLPVASIADTHYVDVNSTSPIAPYTNGFGSAATSIQTAVNAASGGDVVLVAPGTYSLSTVITIGNNITVKSSSGSWSNTIVNGGFICQCFNVTGNAVISGLTITNGFDMSSSVVAAHPWLTVH